MRRCWMVLLCVVVAGAMLIAGCSPVDNLAAPSDEASVEAEFTEYLTVLTSGNVPALNRFWSAEPERMWVKGDLVYRAEAYDIGDVQVAGNVATATATFRVTSLEWSTGETQADIRDFDYVVRYRREADGVWRIVSAPDSLYVLGK
ncbi:MAG: hypothetical protein U1E22_05915 [Coriobacteriia bacterium]|nr:hypothetical protein [Coriobacteriia bacterium]